MKQVVKDFFRLTTHSWNPENFDELLELLKIEYPEGTPLWREWEAKGQPKEKEPVLYTEGYNDNFFNIVKGLEDDTTITIRVDSLREGMKEVVALGVPEWAADDK